MEYSYEEFMEDVKMGHEIEFIYHKVTYFITHDNRGWILANINDKTSQCFTNVEDLLENARIDSKSLSNVWTQVEIDTIY
ncbi:hypothetical protein Q428_15000 [Fervidicella metallireducens AeB]|uniref:Uncharacterized protein n=1 Tax=Fervidicella metallireducens AeB TaxID=1403537 RepID=A0A017RRR7_9CLOT|nr:hypothetical protein [Fervidicella metallireducens]EYE87144.1 hypothetical protein Q428_15000 [Fervidicella metallireducens AeB]